MGWKQVYIYLLIQSWYSCFPLCRIVFPGIVLLYRCSISLSLSNLYMTCRWSAICCYSILLLHVSKFKIRTRWPHCWLCCCVAWAVILNQQNGSMAWQWNEPAARHPRLLCSSADRPHRTAYKPTNVMLQENPSIFTTRSRGEKWHTAVYIVHGPSTILPAHEEPFGLWCS